MKCQSCKGNCNKIGYRMKYLDRRGLKSYEDQPDCKQVFHGKGRILFKDGHIYEGWFKDGKKHGIGRTIYFKPQGVQVHFGMYSNDMQNGLGLFMMPNGNKYIGNWWGSVRNGLGLEYDRESDRIFNGEWDLNQPK